MVSVQSLTGSDFAIFGLSTMLFMLVALSLRDVEPLASRPYGAEFVNVADASSPVTASAARNSSKR
jgi:hypothetical protein